MDNSHDHPLRDSSTGSKCLGEFDLTSIQPSNAYCDVCRNLSLTQHGPEFAPHFEIFGYCRPDSRLLQVSGSNTVWGVALRNSSSGPRRLEDCLEDCLNVAFCQFCAMVRVVLLKLHAIPDHLKPGAETLILFGLEPGRNVSVSIYDQEVQLTISELYCTDEQPYPFEIVGEPTFEPPLYCGDDSLDFIDSCFTHCRRHHVSCVNSDGRETSNGHRVVPSRLLYVGEPGKGLQLVATANLGDRLTYTALSHCWGRTQLARTLRCNLEAFKQEIPAGFVSKVFRDAIELTRRYGIEYIWIDALCIVQDDPEDWSIESSRMDGIYRSAELVICANRSEDGDVPFLGPSAPYVWDHLSFKINTPQGGSSIVKARVADSGYGLLHCHSPLTKRAWAFQEVLLARRCIQFSDKDVRWVCASGIKRLSKPSWKACPEALLEISNSGQKAWILLVTQYSSRALTRPADRLPALAGLAAWYGKRFADAQASDVYLAGIWLSDLALQLAWFSTRGVYEDPRLLSSGYVAPSWSWASLASGCAWLTLLEPVACTKLVSWSCMPSTKNLYGEVQPFSHLVLRGKTIKGWLRRHENLRFKFCTADDETLSGDCTLDGLPFTSEGMGQAESAITRRARSQEEADASKAPGWLAPVVCHFILASTHYKMALILGNTGREANEVERLGIIAWRSETADTKDWFNLFDATQDSDIKIV